MLSKVNCPKCNRTFGVKDWLLSGAIHVVFCEGMTPMDKQIEMVVNDLDGGEE